MVQKEKTVTKARGRCLTFRRRRENVPVSYDFARPWLPPHWTARQDAEALAEIREEMKMLEELGGYCPMCRIFW